MAEKVTKYFDHIWYSVMGAISFLASQHCLPSAKWLQCVLTYMLHERICNRSTYCMLSTSFNYIYKQRNLGFCIRIDHWLFQDDCQIAVSTDVGFTVHTDSGFAENKYRLNLVLLWICYLLLNWSFGETCNRKTVLFLSGVLKGKAETFTQCLQSMSANKTLWQIILNTVSPGRFIRQVELLRIWWIMERSTNVEGKILTFFNKYLI